MTKQEIFDKIVAHARSQRKRSEAEFSDEPGCLYRKVEGDVTLKCFAGVFLDKHYSPSLEGKPANLGIVTKALLAEGIAPEQIGFVHALSMLCKPFTTAKLSKIGITDSSFSPRIMAFPTPDKTSGL